MLWIPGELAKQASSDSGSHAIRRICDSNCGGNEDSRIRENIESSDYAAVGYTNVSIYLLLRQRAAKEDGEDAIVEINGGDDL